MRLTDDRYARQRHKLEIALRLIRHEARTSTIRQCTGLSEDRIRKLHRNYFHAGGVSTTHRRRGKSPQQIFCLTHNLQARLDASLLAGIFKMEGLLEATGKARGALSTTVAERICDSYELFSKLRSEPPRSKFTFEHAWFLARVLLDGHEMATSLCSRCAGLTLKDLCEPRNRVCPLCETKRLADSSQSHRKSSKPQ